jgi:hypothetical protein
MARSISIGDLKNRVRVHVPVETPDEFGDIPAGFAPPQGPHWMSIDRDRKGGLRDHGPGEEPAPAAIAFCHAPVAVPERAVLEVIAGPEGGSVWKVLSSVNPGRGWREMNLERYTGTLPASPP